MFFLWKNRGEKSRNIFHITVGIKITLVWYKINAVIKRYSILSLYVRRGGGGDNGNMWSSYKNRAHAQLSTCDRSTTSTQVYVNRLLILQWISYSQNMHCCLYTKWMHRFATSIEWVHMAACTSTACRMRIVASLHCCLFYFTYIAAPSSDWLHSTASFTELHLPHTKVVSQGCMS
jgi:hypothetical protein